MPEPLLIHYLQPLLAGRRAECFDIAEQALQDGCAPEAFVCDVVWPAMAQVDRLYRDDRITTAIENMACRINRTVSDQMQAHLPKKERNGKRVMIVCADDVREEVGSQIVADLMQSDGWETYFIGGGVPHDELLSLVGELRPEILLIFGTRPQEAPAIRRLTELIREIGVCPTMNIIVSGGVFNRADGLWQEVGADVFAESAREVLALANSLEPRPPQPPRLGIVKKRRRRRRREPVPAQA